MQRRRTDCRLKFSLSFFLLVCVSPAATTFAFMLIPMSNQKRLAVVVESTTRDNERTATRRHATMSSDDHRTHLVIHFDINETILVEDEAGGDSREDCLNKMLAKSAFVQIPRESAASLEDIALVNEDTSNVVPTHWWDGTLIQEEYDKGLAVPPLYTGWQWPAGCCPYYRTAFKTRSKTFVSHHGTIYKPIYEKIHDKLSPGCFKSTDCILSHIIPAFFETLIELSPNKQTTIVLRTFGTDLPDVGAAISEFARGRHPDYPNFFDESLELHWDSFVKGRWSRVNDAVVDSNNNNFVYQLWNANETHVVASGDEAVLDFLHSRRICGIQDDYSHWDSNDCEPWAGKPVWITADPKYHHVLLDDNIHNLEHDSIASVRVQNEDGSFGTLTGAEILKQQGLHLIRVPTVEPILHPHWFLEQLAAARTKFAATYGC